MPCLGRDGNAVDRLLLIDHIAIFLLIAGTYTPIARHLLRPPWQTWALNWAWIGAFLGILLNLLDGPLPAWEATSMYLVMGWGGLICYAGMRASFSHRSLAMVPIGGALYTIGAAFHVTRWPVVWTGVLGPHEVFHLFVIAGAAAHYSFVYNNVAIPTIVPAVATSRTLRPYLLVRVRGKSHA